MSKVLIALAVIVVAAVIGVSSIRSEDEESKDGGTATEKKAAPNRFTVEMRGLTKENSEDVQKALKNIEGVTNVTMMPLKSRGMVAMKPDLTLTSEAVDRALENVKGVTCVSIKEMTGTVGVVPAPNPVKKHEKK